MSEWRYRPNPADAVVPILMARDVTFPYPDVITMGIFILLAVALALIVAVGTLALIHAMRRPERRTLGWALARRLPTTPAEIGLAFEETTVTYDDGTQTTAWLIQGKRPSGPTVVLTHGFRDSRLGMLASIAVIAPFAARLVAYDMRAHGDSTAKRAGLGATESWDLLDLIRQLNLDGDLVLFGASMGCTVSLGAASLDAAGRTPPLPGRIVGLILDGPYATATEPLYGYFRMQRFPTFPFILLAHWHFGYWIKGYRGFNAFEMARRLNRPLLVMQGTADPLCSVASAQGIAQAAPQGRLVLFEDAGHLDLLWCDEDRYCQAVGEFLGQFDREGPVPPPAERKKVAAPVAEAADEDEAATTEAVHAPKARRHSDTAVPRSDLPDESR